MKRSTLLAVVAVVAVVLAACGSSSASPSGSDTTAAAASHHHGGSCGPKHAKTLASDGKARVYSTGGSVFGCSTETGRKMRLGSTQQFPTIDRPTVTLASVGGAAAAYAVVFHGVDTASDEVEIRNLRSGKLLASVPAGSSKQPESIQDVTCLVVRKDGAGAWIIESSSLATHQTQLSVVAYEHGSPVTLDSSAAIAPKSLQLHGSTLSWSDGGQTRHATLS